MGLYKWVRKTKSAFVVAGSSIRYMHRVKPWRKSKVKTKLVGMDEHFFYFHQEIWQRNKKMFFRSYSDWCPKKGAIPTKEVMTAMNLDINQFMEEWVEQWAKWDDLYRSENESQTSGRMPNLAKPLQTGFRNPVKIGDADKLLPPKIISVLCSI